MRERERERETASGRKRERATNQAPPDHAIAAPLSARIRSAARSAIMYTTAFVLPLRWGVEERMCKGYQVRVRASDFSCFKVTTSAGVGRAGPRTGQGLQAGRDTGAAPRPVPCTPPALAGASLGRGGGTPRGQQG